MRKYLLFILLSCIAARGQTITDITEIDLSGLPQPTQAKALRYWFDDDVATVKTSNLLSGSHTLDVSSLIEGLHTLHYQVIDTEDGVAYTRSGLFLKTGYSNEALSVKSMRYWFDDDAGSIQTTGGTTGSYLLNVDQLIEGLHTLHYQLVDGNNMSAYVGSALFLKVDSKANTATAKSIRYWFDDETVSTESILSGDVRSIDVSALLEGLHTIHYQVVGNDGRAYYIASALFLKTGNSFGSGTVSAKKLMYWFDDDTTIQLVDVGEGVQMLDASGLIEGLHTLHYQVLCDNGLMTPAMSTLFLRMSSDSETAVAKSLRYWFDDEQTASEIDIVEGVKLLDASNLIEGLHAVHYQIVDSKGTLGAPYSSMFLKMDASASSGAKSLRYWFDDDATTVRVTGVTNGTQTLDVSGLITGLHTLNYQLIDTQGKVTPTVTSIFIKNFEKVLADGQNRVTKYQYWLNTNTQAIRTVELDADTNPYTLMSLLPMQKEPIQSSQFHFEVTNNVPTIYAKNTLHVRFYDAQNYFTDGQKPFVDYSVKQEVEPVGELQSTQTFPKVTENDIRWYTMQVAQGDTTAFKLSQPATVQVFAPSGKEVFRTSESASLQWSGIHTWEDGTYYVAVHDVTGSQTTMILDYMHMDKYDVVDWDVHTVGNGGCSTITFKGNGFHDLYAVDLQIASGETIHSVDVSHDSDAETVVTFNFSGAELGVYDAVFHFTEEDKHITNVVTVEEAVDIEIVLDVSFPSSFLRGTSTTYSIKITNKGNMTAYAVPLDIRLKVFSVNKISKVVFGGNLKTISIPPDITSSDSIDEEILAILSEEFKNANDISQFVFYRDSVENMDFGLSQFILDLTPNSTETFTVTIYPEPDNTSPIYLDALVRKDWLPLTLSTNNSVKRMNAKRKVSREELCCNRTKIECVADVVANITGVIMPPGANCATSLVLNGLETAFDVWCSDGNTGAERFENYLKSQGKSLASRLVQSAVSCVTFFFNNRLKALRDDRVMAAKLGSTAEVERITQEMNGVRQLMRNTIKSIYEGVMSMVVGKECIDAFTKSLPGCPPDPPGGGSSTPQPPADPNDIYGFLSDAGSKFMADTVEKVHYTIEFENDTEFAQASAHTIVIRDTLDSRYFDLKSFLPTSVKIGERKTFLDETEDVKTTGGVTSFLKTIDMRPEINAIAQVEGEYSQQTGIAKWTFNSLDPMTMEPTDDLMQGILPINYDGTSGIGEVMFEIGVKPNKADGTVIPNRAGIVFDYEDVIMTPTWKNIVDGTAPTSYVADVQMATDTTAAVRIAATDELSGPWRYNVYVQYGDGAWFLGAENVPIDKVANVKVYEGIDHGFYTIVTDSAGNVEQKDAVREFTLEVFGSQVETNTQLALAEGWNWISHNQQEALSAETLKPKAQRIVSQTEELYKDSHFGWSGDLDELLPTEMYKVQMTEAEQVQLSGLLFNAAFRSVPLREGWNWIGYPVNKTMTPTEALAKLEAEEGDVLIGQDGMTQYNDGQWTGTLMELNPGHGYMYRSVSDKNLFLNATAQSSSRRAFVQRRKASDQYPEVWQTDKRKYPNVMGTVIRLCKNGVAINTDEWLVGAFCGDECRGVAEPVSDVLMMNVYGRGSEQIVFRVIHRESGELVGVSGQETFRTDLLGTMQHPYELNIGQLTGIKEIDISRIDDPQSIYDLQGRKIENGQSVNGKLNRGVYIVTDGNNSQTQKVVKK